jgi:hypothetical protein
MRQPLQAIAAKIITLDEERASVMGRLDALRGAKGDALGRLESLRAQHEKNEHANKEESKTIFQPGGVTPRHDRRGDCHVGFSSPTENCGKPQSP